jgi:hypothetical protein
VFLACTNCDSRDFAHISSLTCREEAHKRVLHVLCGICQNSQRLVKATILTVLGPLKTPCERTCFFDFGISAEKCKPQMGTTRGLRGCFYVSYGRFLAPWTLFGCGENNTFRGVQCGFLNPPTGQAQNHYGQTSLSIIGFN